MRYLDKRGALCQSNLTSSFTLRLHSSSGKDDIIIKVALISQLKSLCYCLPHLNERGAPLGKRDFRVDFLCACIVIASCPLDQIPEVSRVDRRRSTRSSHTLKTELAVYKVLRVAGETLWNRLWREVLPCLALLACGAVCWGTWTRMMGLTTWEQFKLTKSGLSCLNLATRESRAAWGVMVRTL